ncbi:MAG: hypothetical protein GY804_01450 [Alphaproteobacteria bacterium]|nr:hypothetical protein [Alphaproteobacteria bacterium]
MFEDKFLDDNAVLTPQEWNEIKAGIENLDPIMQVQDKHRAMFWAAKAALEGDTHSARGVNSIVFMFGGQRGETQEQKELLRIKKTMNRSLIKLNPSF